MKTTKEILHEMKAELDARDREIEVLRAKLTRRPDRSVFRTGPNGERKEVPEWHMLESLKPRGR